VSRRWRVFRPRLPTCHWPAACQRAATQAQWGCRPHWFKLPPDIRARLWQAEHQEMAALGRLGPAWAAVAAEADAWAASHLAAPPRSSRRQRELPL
jgi:hypothetical protein